MKRFLIMTDIEGVSGVTTFAEAESSQFGKDMLMNDLLAVLRAVDDCGAEAVVYDMHTDGRNIDMSRVNSPVVRGKPILGDKYRGIDGKLDGLFLLGLHTMQHTGALLAHSYLREYDAIYINGILVGEIGMEAALAAEQGVALKFVSGDDLGCKEALELVPEIVTCPVKTSLGDDTALCLAPSESAKRLYEKAREAVSATVTPWRVEGPYEIKIVFSRCAYLDTMKRIHPEIFESENTVVMRGDNLLETWSRYLKYEREMVSI